MWRNMTLYKTTLFYVFSLVVMKGVFGVDGDEVKSVSVMEGDSVTLHTNVTQIQRRDQILWMLAHQETRIAEINKEGNVLNDDNGTFKGKLQLNNKTGSLTITNISITHSGLYKLTITNSRRRNSSRKYYVFVYAPLPVPVITYESSQCPSSSSSSNCSLLCSVMNVRDVSLSWYKGNSLLSRISVSDLNIRLSLPLEVEYQDTNTYRCVVNNNITNQTQHLNINICQLCPETWTMMQIVAVTTAVFLLMTIVCVMCCNLNKFINSNQSE
ncbi:SLAM family member 5-like [Paramisgurnus dabryanus]|uniref:SLAM family member 5-like n=1 Tax=Paramisgurnus dabryanus TaxID=90735 RepID=UPI0031F37BB7